MPAAKPPSPAPKEARERPKPGPKAPAITDYASL
jgi:hypothetical protein